MFRYSTPLLQKIHAYDVTLQKELANLDEKKQESAFTLKKQQLAELDKLIKAIFFNLAPPEIPQRFLQGGFLSLFKNTFGDIVQQAQMESKKYLPETSSSSNTFLLHSQLLELGNKTVSKYLNTLPSSFNTLKITRTPYPRLNTLIDVFKELTPQIKTVCLNEIYLYEFGPEGVHSLLKNLSHATSINISGNELGICSWRHNNGISNVLADLPPQVTEFDLSDNNFVRIDSKDIGNIVERLSKQVKSLHLGHNSLGDHLRDNKEIMQMALLPLSRITDTLKLDRNDLSSDQISLLTLSPSLKKLDLSRNYFGEHKFIDVVKTLPPALIELNLSGSHLFRLGAEGLTEMLRALPLSTTVNLSGNELHRLGLETVVAILATTGRNVILDNDEFGRQVKERAQRAPRVAFLQAMKSSASSSSTTVKAPINKDFTDSAIYESKLLPLIFSFATPCVFFDNSHLPKQESKEEKDEATFEFKK